jgi:hypothetical protein
MEPMQVYAGIEFIGTEVFTGLPEYRNGGLFVDMGVLLLKPDTLARGRAHVHSGSDAPPRFEVYDDAVVEWRALTVALLDKVGAMVRDRYGKTEKELPLVKVLEAGEFESLLDDGCYVCLSLSL